MSGGPVHLQDLLALNGTRVLGNLTCCTAAACSLSSWLLHTEPQGTAVCCCSVLCPRGLTRFLEASEELFAIQDWWLWRVAFQNS